MPLGFCLLKTQPNLFIVHRKDAKHAKVSFFKKYMMKISEKLCDFVRENNLL